MFYALSDRAKICAAPRMRASCPLCARAVIAKCGEHVEWHWAHEIGAECDSWHELETPWHLWWKECAPSAWREASMGAHRADIRRDDGSVIELQHSAISSEEIREREAFYERMIWVLDGRAYNFNLSEFGFPVPRIEQQEDGWWIWRRPRRSFVAARKRVCIDLGERVLEILRFDETRSGFYFEARVRPRDEFLEKVRLTPPSIEKSAEITSYTAEWRVPFLPRDSTTLKERSKRREFRDAASLRSWHRRHDPAGLFRILAWHRDGRMIANDDLLGELCGSIDHD